MIAAAPQTAVANDMEWTACEICGSEDRTFDADRRDLFLDGSAIYRMYRCNGCGAIYQYPRPTAAAIHRFYPDEYQQYTPDVAAESWLRQLDRRYGLRKRCRLITERVADGRLLDVGCATGDFLSEMKRQLGWSVVGLEPNRTAAAYARQHVGVPVISGVLNEAPFADESFDAITMWDVLEHVYNPPAVLSAAARLLRPGGLLVINHPNVESIDRRIFGRYWLGYELPRHLYLYPHGLLRRLMAEHGLTEVSRRCLYGSHAASSTSLALMAEDRFGRGRLTGLIRAALYSRLLRIMFLPYFKVIDGRRMGSNITVIFEKRA